MLEVRLCKPAIYKLKILGRGKFEYYKSMGENTKREGNQIFKIQWGKAKGRGHDFLLKFSLGKNLGGNYAFANGICPILQHFQLSGKSASHLNDQGLMQAVFDIGISILGTLIWACPYLILNKTESAIKPNSSFFDQISDIM